jgi:hypothetical protein
VAWGAWAGHACGAGDAHDAAVVDGSEDRFELGDDWILSMRRERDKASPVVGAAAAAAAAVAGRAGAESEVRWSWRMEAAGRGSVGGADVVEAELPAGACYILSGPAQVSEWAWMQARRVLRSSVSRAKQHKLARAQFVRLAVLISASCLC